MLSLGLGDAPNSDLTFNVFKPHNIALKPKPSKDYLLEKKHFKI